MRSIHTPTFLVKMFITCFKEFCSKLFSNLVKLQIQKHNFNFFKPDNHNNGKDFENPLLLSFDFSSLISKQWVIIEHHLLLFVSCNLEVLPPSSGLHHRQWQLGSSRRWWTLPQGLQPFLQGARWTRTQHPDDGRETPKEARFLWPNALQWRIVLPARYGDGLYYVVGMILIVDLIHRNICLQFEDLYKIFYDWNKLVLYTCIKYCWFCWIHGVFVIFITMIINAVTVDVFD